MLSKKVSYPLLTLAMGGSMGCSCYVISCQAGSRRTLSDLTLLPIAKVNILNVLLDSSQRVLRIHALVPRKQAVPDSPLDLCIFSCPVDQSKVSEAQHFIQTVIDHVYQGIYYQLILKDITT